MLEKRLLARRLRGEAKRYVAVIEAALDGFWVNDLKGRFLDVNSSYCRMIGYTREELLTMSISDVEALEKPEETAQRVRKIIEQRSDLFETRHRRKDGKIIDVEVSANYVDADGGYMVVFLRDITERKKAEEELRESEAKFRGLFENVPDGIFQTTPDDRTLAVNPALVRILGYESEEELLKAKPSSMWMKPEKRKAYVKKLEREGVLRNVELHLKRKDGQEAVVLENTHAVRDEQGKVLYYEGTMTDITERRRIEEALKKSEEEYRTLFENASDVIVTFDLKGNVTSINKAVEEYGIKKNEIVGKSMLRFVSKKYRPEVLKKLAEIAGGNKVEGEIGLITPKGEKIAEYRGNPIMLGKKIVGFQSILRDITERKQMEDELTYERSLLRSLMDNIPDSVYFKDRDSRFMRVNRAHAQNMGLNDPEDGVGKTDSDFYTEKFAREAWVDEQTIVKKGRPLIGKVEKVIRPDGKFHWVSVSKVPVKDSKGRVTGIIGINRDISELKQAEEALRASEERYRSVIEGMHESLAIVGEDQRIEYVNPQVERHTGYKLEELIGERFDRFLTPESLKSVVESYEKRRRGELFPSAYEVQAVTKGGVLKDFEVSVSVCSEAGKLKTVVVFEDITERKRMLKDLK